MRVLAAILFVTWSLLLGCSTLNWQPRDQALFGVSLACQALDFTQTEAALDTGRFIEKNPLLGEHPSDATLAATKIAMGTLAWWVADQVEPEYRWRALLLGTVPCVFAIAHNYSEGARP